MKQFALQFGFRPFFIAAWPGDDIPIFSIDVLIGYLQKSRPASSPSHGA